MKEAEQQVDVLFEAIRRDDPTSVNAQFASLTSAHQYGKLYELTARYVAPGSHVLDWGCGRGHFSYFLVKRGFRVTAYSLEDPPNIFATLSVSERERLTFIRGEPGETRRLPFESGAFTAAFSVGVLEHVQERDGDELTSLLELNRVLTDDGVFICYHLPNRYSYIEALSRCYGRPFFHRYRFTARDIRNLCLKAGLSVVESGRYGFLPRNSLSRLPDRICNSPVMAVAINRGDAVLERLLSPIVQNYYFVARLGPKGSSANIRALA